MTEDFNDKARRSNIGSKYPLKSSQYKHPYEYHYNQSWRFREGADDDDTDPLHLKPARGAVHGILIGTIMWLMIGLVLHSCW